LGLGLVVAGSILMAKEWTVAVKLLLIWLAVLVASTISCYLIANAARKRKINPWKIP
jgi:multicomponent Na+:H+ antiporter subunit G